MLKTSDNPRMLALGVDQPSALAGAWWVAHTRARAEKALAWDLIDRGIGHFLPLAERTMLWGGRKRKILTPLFPSYVFFCGDERDRQEVFGTGRICQALGVKFRQQFVQELDNLHRALVSGCQLDLYPRAAVGSRWRVAKGPLQGIEGLIVRKHDGLRLVLQVSLLGQGAALETTADMLEPAD